MNVKSSWFLHIGLRMHCFENYKKILLGFISNTTKFFFIGLYSEIWIYKEGIISNRKPACYGESVKFTLHT
jgi:hypothetical protein